MISRPLRLFLLITLSTLATVIFAQTSGQLRLTRIDASAFPEVTLNLIVTDQDLSPITDLSTLQVFESGAEVTDLALSRVPVGVELFVVLDANQSLEVVDAGSDLSRLRQAQSSIVRYASDYMDGQGLDRTHIIVPGGEGGQFLLEAASEPVAVLGAVNAYEPPELPALTPLQDMMALVLERAAQSRSDGRFQAVLLYTNGADLNRQLDFESLTAQASEMQLPIFVAILGSRADPDEVANAARLYEPTGAFYVHAPTPLDTDPVFTAVQAHATQAQVRYESGLRRSATVPVEVRFNGQVVTGTFDVDLQPPSVAILQEPIIVDRVADEPEAALFQLMPIETAITAAVSWPDGHPRSLVMAELIVDGVVVVAAESPMLSEDGELSLPWNLRAAAAGTAGLVVQVQDDFGLAARSPEAMATVRTIWPTPVPTISPTVPAPTAAPAQIAAVVWREIPDWLRYVAIGGVGLLAATIVIVLARAVLRRLRRRRPADDELPTATEGVTEMPDDAAPPLAVEELVPHRAYLEILANGAPHEQNVLFLDDSVTLGRDAEVADVVFIDRSVSRLHARIRLSDGRYWLYDEGSAAGTYRNFKRVGLMPQAMTPGDEIHLGQVRLRFHWDPGYHPSTKEGS